MQPLRTRSLVGLAPLFTVQILDTEIDKLPGFSKRLKWFLDNRRDLRRTISYLEFGRDGRRLLAVPTRERLERTLRYMLDESEFLSPYGIRSLSRAHLDAPFSFNVDGRELQVRYTPAESDTYMFGGNSNWRGPVWFPLNFLLIEALEIYGDFYGDQLTVEHPTGSGRRMPLTAVARDLARRLTKLFVPDPTTDSVRVMASTAATPTTPVLATSSCSTSTSTGTTGAGAAPATRQGGRRWWRAAWRRPRRPASDPLGFAG